MARKLEAAGFPGPQAAGAAAAMAEAMSGAELATKADLLGTKPDLQQESRLLRTELTREIGLLRSDLEREIGHVRSDMTAMEMRLSTSIIRVGSDLELLRRDMTIRLGAIAIASTGIVLGAMRYMVMHPWFRSSSVVVLHVPTANTVTLEKRVQALVAQPRCPSGWALGAASATAAFFRSRSTPNRGYRPRVPGRSRSNRIP